MLVLRPIRGAMIMNIAIPVISPPANIRCPSGTGRIVRSTDRNNPCLLWIAMIQEY